MSSVTTQGGAGARRRGSRLRVAGVVVAVLAILVHLNLAQTQDEHELALRTTGVLTPYVDRVLAERRSAVIATALEEYLTLVAAGVGLVLAIAGPRLYVALLCVTPVGAGPGSAAPPGRERYRRASGAAAASRR